MTIFSALRALCGSRCVLCHGQAFSDGLCAGCRDDLADTLTAAAAHCPRCFRTSAAGSLCGRCQQKPPPFERLWVSAYYEPPLSGMLHAFKHLGRPDMLPPLAAVMRRNPPPWLEQAAIGAVMAVPLSKARRLERGFNQCDELVSVLARHYGWRILPRQTVFRRHGVPQSTLPSAKRHQNIRHAFEIKGNLQNDCNVLLIDDVATTGATLGALAQSLKTSGAGRIYCWTLARSRLKNQFKRFDAHKSDMASSATLSD